MGSRKDPLGRVPIGDDDEEMMMIKLPDECRNMSDLDVSRYFTENIDKLFGENSQYRVNQEHHKEILEKLRAAMCGPRNREPEAVFSDPRGKFTSIGDIEQDRRARRDCFAKASTSGSSASEPSTSRSSNSRPSTSGPSTSGPSTSRPSTSGSSTSGSSTSGSYPREKFTSKGDMGKDKKSSRDNFAKASTSEPSTSGPSTSGPSVLSNSSAKELAATYVRFRIPKSAINPEKADFLAASTSALSSRQSQKGKSLRKPEPVLKELTSKRAIKRQKSALAAELFRVPSKSPISNDVKQAFSLLASEPRVDIPTTAKSTKETKPSSGSSKSKGSKRKIPTIIADITISCAPSTSKDCKSTDAPVAPTSEESFKILPKDKSSKGAKPASEKPKSKDTIRCKPFAGLAEEFKTPSTSSSSKEPKRALSPASVKSVKVSSTDLSGSASPLEGLFRMNDNFLGTFRMLSDLMETSTSAGSLDNCCKHRCNCSAAQKKLTISTEQSGGTNPATTSLQKAKGEMKLMIQEKDSEYIRVMTEKIAEYFRKDRRATVIIKKANDAKCMSIAKFLDLVNILFKNVLKVCVDLTPRNFAQGLPQYLFMLRFPLEVDDVISPTADLKEIYPLILGILHWLSSFHLHMTAAESLAETNLFVPDPDSDETEKLEMQEKDKQFKNHSSKFSEALKSMAQYGNAEVSKKQENLEHILDNIKERANVKANEKTQDHHSDTSEEDILEREEQELERLEKEDKKLNATIAHHEEYIKRLKMKFSELEKSNLDMTSTLALNTMKNNQEDELEKETDGEQLVEKTHKHSRLDYRVNKQNDRILRAALMYNTKMRHQSLKCPHMEEFVFDMESVLEPDLREAIRKIVDRAEEIHFLLLKELKKDREQLKLREAKSKEKYSIIRSYEKAESQIIHDISTNCIFKDEKDSLEEEIESRLKLLAYKYTLMPSKTFMTNIFLAELRHLIVAKNVYHHELALMEEVFDDLKKEFTDYKADYTEIAKQYHRDLDCLD